MAWIRTLLKDRSCAAAIVLVLAQVVVLASVLGGASAAYRMSDEAVRIVHVMCDGAGAIQVADGEGERHACCDDPFCAVLCAQTANYTSSIILSGFHAAYSDLRCGETCGPATHDIRTWWPRRSAMGTGLRDPPCDVRRITA